MKITICGSMAFAKEMRATQKVLEKRGLVCFMPEGVDSYIGQDKDISSEESTQRKIAKDLIRQHYNFIKKSDAILVLNYNKKGIENYIGGNTFLEIGFAHILNKTIYLLNPIPAMSYSDEIIAMSPTILNGNLTKITKE